MSKYYIGQSGKLRQSINHIPGLHNIICCPTYKMQVTATVRTWAGASEPQIETRVFSALASGLVLLAQWLVGLRVTGAVMEATGIYWEKVYDLLGEAGLDVKVVNAQHVKQLKGRKTDVADSIWLARICQFEMASPSLILPKLFRDLRGLSRYRRTLIEQRAQKQVRIQKVLDRNGVRVGGVLTRITRGVNGRRILEGIVCGEAPESILSAMTWHVRNKLKMLGDALSFELDEHSRWVLADLLRQFDFDTDRIDQAGQRIEAALSPFEALIRLLETIPGVSRESAMAILIELGPDMSVFPSARHCAAWAGLCPGNNESAGKRRSGRTRRGNPTLRAVLIECAHAAIRTSGCQFQGYHEAVKSRRGYKRAVVATAHKMLRTIYAMLRDGKPYVDPGIDYEGISIDRKAARWLKKLEQYGYVAALDKSAQHGGVGMSGKHA